MGEQARKIGRRDAAKVIVDQLVEMMGAKSSYDSACSVKYTVNFIILDIRVNVEGIGKAIMKSSGKQNISTL